MSAATRKAKWWQSLVDELLAGLGSRLKEQDARIAALEQRISEFKYCGVWQPGTVYRESNSVTDSGSLWMCMAPQTTQRPGDGPDWRLAVKRGKDGKDARP